MLPICCLDLYRVDVFLFVNSTIAIIIQNFYSTFMYFSNPLTAMRCETHKSFGKAPKVNTVNLGKVPVINNVLELKKELEATNNRPNSVPKTVMSFGYSFQTYLQY